MKKGEISLYRSRLYIDHLTTDKLYLMNLNIALSQLTFRLLGVNLRLMILK